MTGFFALLSKVAAMVTVNNRRTVTKTKTTTDRQMDKWAGGLTGRQAGRQTYIQTDRQKKAGSYSAQLEIDSYR